MTVSVAVATIVVVAGIAAASVVATILLLDAPDGLIVKVRAM